MPMNYPLKTLSWSNLLTYLSLLASLVGIQIIIETSEIVWVAPFFLITALLDLLDGRFASLFERSKLEKELGTQLDSFVDLIAFGVFPVVVAHCLFIDELSFLSLNFWFFEIAVSFYLLSLLSRLALYNLESAGTDFFVGVPSTLMNVFWAVFYLFPTTASLCGGLFLVLALLMGAPIKIKRPDRRAMVLLISIKSALLGFYLLNAFKVF
jgi:phosphatidylserine synthase